ncbi:hypothetical protein [Psychroserpens damuponensis]|uniref:hypothetical protein n=1 Tax=Psychroserpens damuponensis TaxID=943936 RepID=UPI000B28E01B|nr:hypothetical protein [Psychroserpens damuponensis]
MKQYIKITSFIIAICTVVIFSKQIQDEIVERYNTSVEQLASLSMTSSNPIGF